MLRDLSLGSGNGSRWKVEERRSDAVTTTQPLVLAAPSRTAAIESDATNQCPSSDISDYIFSMALGSTFAIGAAHPAIQSESARERARCLSATDSSSCPLGQRHHGSRIPALDHPEVINIYMAKTPGNVVDWNGSGDVHEVPTITNGSSSLSFLAQGIEHVTSFHRTFLTDSILSV
ncbi:lytic polysaccharide monooxygenase [Sphaerobolus stellatus SS14]|uniref:Lytic polysaccharide monooxygenase n=1 Tax=Sphaerobolus stellatus (strain SS14) TaxID=990650 RepID=A0A0C9U839_SPHS4|nr:lytic polysaccharide monooxygenase [Sphaerobolus stellatus SS14]